MQFTFNEGHIQLPSQWQDQSMQVLVSTDNSGINLVITRSRSTGNPDTRVVPGNAGAVPGQLMGTPNMPRRESPGRGPGLAAGLFPERSGR